MMKHLPVLYFIFITTLVHAQVGIGTTTPNEQAVLDLTSISKGLLLPRMTWEQRMAMQLGPEDAGMMVYQTDLPSPPNNFIRGVYYFNGQSWLAPIHNGILTGQTLRWDGKSWSAVSNLFNQGNSIGINIQSPNYQFHLHSISPSTKMQFTNGPTTNAYHFDGMVVGVGLLNTEAYVLQLESKPLWFGTDSLERMRIDSAGQIGINTTMPEARLDVNGSVRLGEHGSVIHDVIKVSLETLIPEMDGMAITTIQLPCPHTEPNAVVHVSPASSLEDIMIMSSRVSVPGTVEIKLMNMGDTLADPLPVTFHVAVIQ